MSRYDAQLIAMYEANIADCQESLKHETNAVVIRRLNWLIRHDKTCIRILGGKVDSEAKS